MVMVQLMEGGRIMLPPEAVSSLELKEGDILECIYGKRQIGLSPIKAMVLNGDISPPKIADQMFWELWSVPGRLFCAGCQ